MSMSKKFQRTVENFKCENCGTSVNGNGYTNHCTKCLCSKHVDINPGDRESKCGGLMEPAAIEQKKGEYIIVHHCIKCGHERKNKTSPNDDIEAIMKVSQLGVKVFPKQKKPSA